MLYWDKVNGTNLWQETITEVKEKYPKPVEPETGADEAEPVEESEVIEDGLQREETEIRR